MPQSKDDLTKSLVLPNAIISRRHSTMCGVSSALRLGARRGHVKPQLSGLGQERGATPSIHSTGVGSRRAPSVSPIRDDCEPGRR